MNFENNTTNIKRIPYKLCNFKLHYLGKSFLKLSGTLKIYIIIWYLKICNKSNAFYS